MTNKFCLKNILNRQPVFKIQLLVDCDLENNTFGMKNQLYQHIINKKNKKNQFQIVNLH